MILFLGAGVIVSYALIYSGISTLQLGKENGVSTLGALWPKGAKVLPSSFPKPAPSTGPGPGQPRRGRPQ